MGVFQKTGSGRPSAGRRCDHRGRAGCIPGRVYSGGDGFLHPSALRRLHRRHRHDHRHRAGAGDHGAGKLYPALFFQVPEGVLAALACLHEQLVPGLPVLSGLHLQGDAEGYPPCQSPSGRKGGQAAAGVSVHVCGLVRNRRVARGELEFYCLGPRQLGGADGLGGAGAAVCEIPSAVRGAGEALVQAVSGGAALPAGLYPEPV